MRLDDMQFMPHVQQLIGNSGATFDNYFDNVSLCCPARASILRGQYSHNTGVLGNGGTNGGFETAFARGIERSTIATALHDDQYRTGLFGKYLNGYPDTAGPGYIPPGWDRWVSPTSGNAYGEYDYTANEDGKQVPHGNKPEDYGTNLYMREAKSFIDDAIGKSKSFFAYVSVYAPHEPATPALQDAGAFPGLQAPRDPAFDEADVSDKPAFVQAFPPLTDAQQQTIDAFYRKRAQSLQAVDRGVAMLVDELRAKNQLDHTYLIFASDNGLHLGQHRLPNGKETAYETDIHLPLLIAGPGIAPTSHVGALAGNVDLAPTMADMAGTKLTDNADGRSLVPLVRGPAAAQPGNWRQVFLLEHWTEVDSQEGNRSGAAVEPADPDQQPSTSSGSSSSRRSLAASSPVPEFQGLRMAGYTYVEYATGERELYDLTADPNELDNMAATANPTLLGELHQRLQSLRSCAGDGCRTVESGPAPSSR
jgi:arylsulfatase A-like enzyme